MFPFSVPLFLLNGLGKLKSAGSWAYDNWKLIVTIIVVVLLIALALYARSLRQDLTAAREEARVNALKANENLQKVLAVQKQAEDSIQAIVEERQKAAARTVVARKREKEILNVAKDQDGVPSPVLRATLQRLRDEPEPAAQ